MSECVIVNPNGTLRFLVSDRTEQAFSEASVLEIHRVSHVDVFEDLDPKAKTKAAPGSPTSWYADMSPVNGPVLGPFRSRKRALQEERYYLERRNLL